MFLVLLGFLTACESSPVVQEEVNETSEKTISDVEEIDNVVLIYTFIEGLEQSLERFLNRPFEIVTSLDGIDIGNYERVMVLFDDALRREISPTTLNGPRLSYLEVVTFPHPDGVEMTMIYLDDLEEYQEMFQLLDDQLFLINEPQIVYELYPLQGIHAYVADDSFDQQMLLQNLPIGTQLAPLGDNVKWFYTSEVVYLFLDDDFPTYLASYAAQLRGLNERVVVLITPRGQKLIIGRAYGPNAASSYELFVEAVAAGIDGPQSLTPPPPPVIPLQEGRIAHPDICYLRDNRGMPQNTTVSHDIPERRLSSIGQLVGLNIMVSFNEYPSQLSDLEYRNLIQDGLDISDQFYNEMSNGQLSFEWRFHPDVVNIPFFLEPGIGPASPDFERLTFEAIEQIVAIVEQTADLTDVDIIQLFWPLGTPDYVYGGIEVLLNERMDTQRGNIFNFNVKKLEQEYLTNKQIFGRTLYHGIGHNLGLTDIYVFNFMEEFQGLPTTLKYGNWDMMTSAINELNGWHRWILSWVDDEQVHCIPASTDQEFEVFLEPLNEAEAETRLIVISLSQTEAISIELRGPGTFCPISKYSNSKIGSPQGGCTQNVLITHIDATVENGWGPMQIIRPARSTQEDYSDSLLLEGEFVTFENITITHSEKDSSGSTITIRFD